MTVGEILALAHKFGWGEEKRKAMKELLGELVIVDINIEDVLDRYAEISYFLSSFQPAVTIQQNDMWIATVASLADAHVITTDKDYKWLHPKWIKLHWIDETLAV